VIKNDFDQAWVGGGQQKCKGEMREKNFSLGKPKGDFLRGGLGQYDFGGR